MKIYYIVGLILFLNFLSGCGSKEEKRNNTINNNDTIAKQEGLKTDPISKKTIVLDSVFTIVSIDTLKLDTLIKNSFQLKKEFRFFPLSQKKIITNYIDPGYGSSDDCIIVNPFTNETSDTIKLMSYADELIQYTRKGSSPEETIFLVNNEGKVKVMANSYSDYSVGNLYPLNNKNALVVWEEKEKNEIVISDLNKVYSSNDCFFINDTIYRYREGLSIQVFNKNEFLYSYNLHNNSSFKFKDRRTLELRDESVYNIDLFPVANLVFFSTDSLDFTILLGYNVITGLTKKYILPVWTNHFYLAKDGFYIEYSHDIERREGKESHSSESYTYGFIKY